MLFESIKIGGKTVGVSAISSNGEEHEEAGVWISKTLVRQVLRSECEDEDVVVTGI